MFVEVDLATTTQTLLIEKADRYVDYAQTRARADVHPMCPPMLLLTTAPAGAATFVRAARKLVAGQVDRDDALVTCTCGLVRDSGGRSDRGGVESAGSGRSSGASTPAAGPPSPARLPSSYASVPLPASASPCWRRSSVSAARRCTATCAPRPSPADRLVACARLRHFQVHCLPRVPVATRCKVSGM